MSMFRHHLWRLWLSLSVLTGLGGCFPGEIRDRHAAVVERYLRTAFLDDGQPFADPARALGPPDGRTVALGVGSYLVLRFFREIPDGSGPDLRIYEVGADGAQAAIAVSRDGVEFVELAKPAQGPTTDLDLEDAGETGAFFVRIRGLDDLGLEPGFDLDAVEALH